MLYKRIICASPLPCARGAREDSARWPRNRLVEQENREVRLQERVEKLYGMNEKPLQENMFWYVLQKKTWETL